MRVTASNTHQYDVVISGGGPVGLGLAIELGQRDIRVCVIERAETPARIPKGQNLTQRTMEHMQAWGVEGAIRAAKTIPKGVGLGGLTAYGTLLSGHHYDWFKRAVVRPYYNADNERLPQYATEAVLRERVAALPVVDVRYGWSTEGVDQDADGVFVEAKNGGQTAQITGQYLVGCDGSHSRVRRLAGISETQDDHDRLMALVVFRSPEFFRLIERFPDKQFYNVLHPDHDGYWMFFGMVEWGQSFFFHAPVPADTDRENFDFGAYIRRAVGADFDLDLEYVGFWDLRISVADTYRDKRVFVAGDAAHSHPPYGGYGINTGFEDARNLGWKLAAVLHGWGGGVLLDSYDAERRAVFHSTADDFIGKFIVEDRAFVRGHDPEKDRAAFEAAWAARAQGGDSQGISTFAPHYEGSPIIAGTKGKRPSAVGDHEFAARPGHHLAPIGSVGQGSVIDALGSGFTLLDCGASKPVTDSFAKVSQELGLRLKVLSLSDTADGSKYGHALVLVRPDGYVAWTGDTAESIRRILSVASGQEPLLQEGE